MKSIMFLFFACYSIMCGELLYASEYIKDWKAFEKEIETSYPFFKLKGIHGDWNKRKQEYRKQVTACKDDAEFIKIIDNAIDCLRDGHAGIVQAKIPVSPREQFCLPLSLRQAREGSIVVVSSKCQIKPGTIIDKINDIPADRFMKKRISTSWKKGGCFSSPQRAAFLEYGMPLRAEEITEYSISFKEDGKNKKIQLKNDYPGKLPGYNFPPNLKREKGYCLSTMLSDGIGYIYLRRIRGEETAMGVRDALKNHPDAYAWIIDLRGNGGGGYDNSLMESFRELMIKPIVVLTDAGCFSAGETLVRDIKNSTKTTPIIFGATTAGSSSSKKNWTFPSGIATIRFSVASRHGLNGKPIEFHGIEPDIVIQADSADLAKEQDTEIVKAQEFFKKSKN